MALGGGLNDCQCDAPRSGDSSLGACLQPPMLPNNAQPRHVANLQHIQRVPRSTCLNDMFKRPVCSFSILSKPTRPFHTPKSSTRLSSSSVRQIRPSQPCFQLLSKTPDRRGNTDPRRNGSSIALHSEQPFNSSPDPDPDTPPKLSDNEWEIRTGQFRANLYCVPAI